MVLRRMRREASFDYADSPVQKCGGPAGIVWIMRTTDGVEIEALHGQGIEAHGFAVEGFTFAVVVIVAVDAVNENSPVVDEQVVVANFDGAEPDSGGSGFNDFDLWIFQGDHGGVEIGKFHRPEQGFFDGHVEPRLGAETAVALAAGIEQAGFHSPPLFGLTGETGLHGELQTGHPTLVLIFDEGGIGPFDHDRANVIFLAAGDLGRDGKFGGQATVFAHTDKLAVDEKIEHAFSASEMNDDPAALNFKTLIPIEKFEPGRRGSVQCGRRSGAGKG